MATKPNFIYTFVAYRENGVDTCRGCVMGRSDSDFELKTFTDPEMLAAYWAQHKFSAPTDREFCSYDYTLLLNGVEPHHDIEWDEQYQDKESNESFFVLERNRVMERVEFHFSLLQDDQRQRDVQAAAALAAKQKEEAAKMVAAQEEKELREFRRLHAKFGGQVDSSGGK